MPQEPSFRPPTPILDKVHGPMDARFLSSVGLGFGTCVGRSQLFPTTAGPALGKNRFPIETDFGHKTNSGQDQELRDHWHP